MNKQETYGLLTAHGISYEVTKKGGTQTGIAFSNYGYGFNPRPFVQPREPQ